MTLPAAYMKETHMCGGILLNENFVLTAAHCLFRNNVPLSASQVAVGFGHNLVQVYQDGRVSVKKVITHEKFERVGKGLNEYSRHDIALLQLTYPRSFVKDIDMSPACLSTSKSAGTDAQKMLTAIGFGGTKAIRMDKQSYEMGHKPKVEISALLRELNLVDISPNHPLCSLNKQLICTQALSGNGSLCLGDSGSPLQIIKQGMTFKFKMIRENESTICFF